jgi:hypothetical protein
MGYYRPVRIAAFVRTLLYVVVVDVVTALLDSLLYWMTGDGSSTILLWVTWQLVTLFVLVINVPPIFETVQSAFVRRVAVVSLMIVLQAITSYLGVLLFGNVRELFGVPI